MNYSDTEQLRVPPHDVEAERAVLGGLMLANDQLVAVADWLLAEDFYRRDHQLIYRGILELAERQKPFDPVTVGDWFHQQGVAEQVANGAYLTELGTEVFTAANVVAYAEIIQQKSRLRKLIDIGTDMVNAAFQPRGAELDTIVGEMQQRILGLDTTRQTGAVSYAEGLQEWFDDFQDRVDGIKAVGLPTPWKDVNDAIGGLEDGMVYVLAACSNMGKSVAGGQLAKFTALRKNRVMLFSMEMTRKQVQTRDIASLMSIPYAWLRNPNSDPEGDELHSPKLTLAIRDLRAIDYIIDETPRLSARQIRARARREHLRKPLRLVVVDHLHEMDLPGKKREDSEIGDNMRDLAALAKDLNCPVVVLAQLNRGARKQEGGTARRPTMGDLHGSGGIEQRADVVLFLHRWDAYKSDDRRGLVECIVGKGRDIPTGTVINLRNRFDVMRLDDWGDEPVPGPVAVEAERNDSSFQYRGGYGGSQRQRTPAPRRGGYRPGEGHD